SSGPQDVSLHWLPTTTAGGRGTSGAGCGPAGRTPGVSFFTLGTPATTMPRSSNLGWQRLQIQIPPECIMGQQHPAIRAPFTWAVALSLLVTIPKTGCQAAADDAAVAEVQVRVPANATVWFDGEPTEQTGPYRRFWTPPLEPGKVYTYQVKARWMLDGAPYE